MARRKQMDMTFQPGLFDEEISDEPDRIIHGTRQPIVRHPDHSSMAMRKPFIGWDGEGYTETRRDGSQVHHYWLLQNSLGDMAIAPPGRTLHRHTVARIFDQTSARHPGSIHIGFSLNYDFTMMLRSNSISDEQCGDVMRGGFLRSDGYVFRPRWGKTMEIQGEGDWHRTLIQDVFGYFQKSFVGALDEYMGCKCEFDDREKIHECPDTWPHRKRIVEMKNARSGFDSRDNDEEVIMYCRYELELLVKLMENLRDRCHTANLPISRWYGPGAIADGLMGRWQIKNAQVDLYKEIPELAAVCQHAYAGGRFEVIRPGHTNGRVYQYDIRSAYPAAIAKLPDLKSGRWVHLLEPERDELTEFSVLLMDWDCDTDPNNHPADPYPESIPFPLWRRDKAGNTHYPSQGVVGWYWKPEADAAMAYADAMPAEYSAVYRIREAWSFIPARQGGSIQFDDKQVAVLNPSMPFARVEGMYELRKEMKQKGQGAEKALKLALNSLYGKLCQQIGKPKYHNLAMAGYVTAQCRAKMIQAMTQKPHAVIAFETDAIFSSEPLELDCENKLGNWELTEYDDMWYLQSGFRFCMKNGKVKKMATRGISVKNVTYEGVMNLLKDSASIVPVKTTNFINMRWALAMRRRDQIGMWLTQDRNMRMMLESDGKRRHDPECDACTPESRPEGDVRVYAWHMTHRTRPNDSEQWELSRPHRVSWNPLSATPNRVSDPNADPDGYNGEGDNLAELS